MHWISPPPSTDDRTRPPTVYSKEFDHPRRFVVLFQARSGSTYLTEALDSHPEIYAAGEMFAQRKSKGEAQLAAIESFYKFVPESEPRAMGFKTKLIDVADGPGFRNLLREVRARVILLGRRNRVKHAVSWFTSQRLFESTGDWNRYGDHDAGALTIDPEQFDHRLSYFETNGRKLESYVMTVEAPTLCLYYEDLLLRKRETIDLALHFLGVNPVEVSGKARKNTGDDLRQVVANFDELRERYVGTPYEAMFDEVLVRGE